MKGTKSKEVGFKRLSPHSNLTTCFLEETHIALSQSSPSTCLLSAPPLHLLHFALPLPHHYRTQLEPYPLFTMSLPWIFLYHGLLCSLSLLLTSSRGHSPLLACLSHHHIEHPQRRPMSVHLLRDHWVFCQYFTVCYAHTPAAGQMQQSAELSFRL